MCAVQEVLEARRKAGTSLALLQALIGPQLRNGARLTAVRDACLASGQPAAQASLQVRMLSRAFTALLPCTESAACVS